MIRALLVAFLCLLAAGAHAQTTLAKARENASRLISELDAKWKTERSSVTFADLDAATRDIWASGDKLAILRLQDLWISVALRERDVSREIGGRLIATMIHDVIDGADSPDTAWAQLALGQAYLKDARRFRAGGHYALFNAIAIAEAIERAGKADDEAIKTRARAYALLGQSFLQSDRPGPAIYFLRNARLMADAAKFSKANRDGVENLMSLAAEELRGKALPDSSVECPPAALRDKSRLNQCVAFGDFLWSRGDLKGVETLFAHLTSEVMCGSVEADEMEAFHSLHFARLLLHGPASDSLSFTVCGLAGRLNGEGMPAWGVVVAWPLIHAHVQRGVFEQRISDVAAHTARRFMRDGNDLLAWLALEATMSYARSASKAADNPSDLVKRRRAFLPPAIAYDMAYIADRNEWPALRDVYREIGEDVVARSDPAAIEAIYDSLALYFDENYGFKAPTPVAAMEVFARIARRLPADHEHHKLTAVVWPRLEQLYRSDEDRAAKVARENLSHYRDLAGADPAVVAMLLQVVADTTSLTEPDKALAVRREALEIVSAIPGRDALRIDLLFEIEYDRRALGDSVGAARYFDEAVSVRRSARELDARTAARVDLRLAVRMFNQGDRAGARALAEAALKSVIENTRGPAQEWLRTTPAKTVAVIVAADGDLERARSLFNEYVFPVTDNAIASGDAFAIDTRLELASLEALHGPTGETVKTIHNLMAAAQRRAASARDIQERGWRSLAIANLGLNDGPAALEAARRAFAMKPAIASQIQDEQSDRRLSETFVAAAWRAQAASTRAP